MPAAGYDISASVSGSSSATSGNTGAVSIGSGGSYGISSTMIAIIAGAALLGFIIFLKIGARRRRK
jgi:hypothetical protein